ncbi:Trehalose/maltose import ATP-binding protein MalK [uncultured archaeon]|nr:Trehalose/maltose import ATP-binding protein MalK [uncultured archaeon]
MDSQEKQPPKSKYHPVINIIVTEWNYLGKRKKRFIFYIFLFTIAGLVSLLTPYVIGSIFNSIQKTISSKEELYSLCFKISLLLIITICFWMLHGVGRVLEQDTGFFVKKNYINDKIRIVLKLPVKWHKDTHSGDTIDKINRASGSLEDFSSNFTFQIVYGLVNLFGSIIVLFFIDLKIGLFALLFSLVTIFIISRVDKRLNVKYQELNKYNNKISAVIFDYISNIITVVTLRLKKTVSEEIDEKLSAGYNTYKATVWINELKWAFASVAIQVMIVSVLIYRSYTEFTLTGAILIGTLYMLYGYLDNVGNTFFRFASLYGDIIRSNARIVGAYPLDEEYEKLGETRTSNLPKNWKEVNFKNISFTYDSKGKTNHLENINFKFERKQKIALVGESGSGKSTILSLIRGLYDIENGSIYCDGEPLSGGVSSIKDSVTLIPQEPEIFNNTFRYNITMNLPAAKEEVDKVVSMSQLAPVLEKLPTGLDTSVMEKGVSLSGGEKQRLALARGLLAARNSDIVLLDEPTSSVDSLNEIKIHEQLFTEFKNKTIISSIHRLHLLDKFDYIYLFSRGKIVGYGTFEEIKKNPLFDKMWRRYNQEKLIDKELGKKDKK